MEGPLGGGEDEGAALAWAEARRGPSGDGTTNSSRGRRSAELKPSLFAEPFTRESGWNARDEDEEADEFVDARTGPDDKATTATPRQITDEDTAIHAMEGLSMTPKHTRSASNSAIFARDSPDVFGTSVTPRERHSFPKRMHDTSLADLDSETAQKVLSEAATAGNLDKVRSILQDRQDTFAIVNSPNAHSTLTPLHRAATYGHIGIVKYLVDEAGAVPDLEDGDGENAMHKASYAGHLQVVQFLALKVAPDAPDSDGWTALHNACSRGYLDIVRFLLEQSKVNANQPSKRGYTPLMNAASKGHAPVVRYLLSKHQADPSLRNQYGETAFDLAAGVFEVELCFEIAAYEQSKQGAVYNTLALHSVVPIVVHENQRLAHPSARRLSTLGQLGQKPRFSSKALTRNDRRSAFTLPHVAGLTPDDIDNLPVLRNEISPPVCGRENVLPLPPVREIRSRGRIGIMPAKRASQDRDHHKRPDSKRSASSSLTAVLNASSTTAEPLESPNLPSASAASSTSAPQGEPAWFFLSDWSVDLTDPRGSARDGWSYAASFDEPKERWSPEPSSELQRFLDGRTPYLGQPKFVRRRRWVRLLRRRLDVPAWGFDTTASSSLSSNDEDYLLRANFAATSYDAAPSTSERRRRSGSTSEEREFFDVIDLRKAAARLIRAIDILKGGIAVDRERERKARAEEQLEAFEHQLLLVTSDLARYIDEEPADDDSDDGFVYEGVDANDDARSVITNGRTPSTFSGQSGPDYFSVSTAPAPQIGHGTEFRVPTHEQRTMPVVVSPPARNATPRRPLPAWEPDESAPSCRLCSRKFTFFLRKHHCRKCGRVFCASCSANLDRLDPDEVVREPGSSDDDPWQPSIAFEYRTCDDCHADLAGPALTAQALLSPTLLPSIAQAASDHTSPERRRGSLSPLAGSEAGQSDLSAVSELADCPVCGTVLASLGGKIDQERHVQQCLDAGNGTLASATDGRYLVFTLQPGPLVGTECAICFCEFEVTDRLARLACLDYFHVNCIRAWLDRGHGCPFHAR